MSDPIEGKWWENTWWKDDDYYLIAPAEKITEAAEFLKEYFPASWVAAHISADSYHPALRYLCMEKGVPAQRFLLSMAETFKALDGVPGLKRKVSELRTDKFDGIMLELRVAATLADAGGNVSFPVEGARKTPDLVVSIGGETVAIECKSLKREARDDWQSLLMHEVAQAMPTQVLQREVITEVELDRSLADLLLGQDFHDVNRAVLKGVAQQIRTQLDELLSSVVDLPVQVMMPGLATVGISEKREGLYGSVGIPVSLVGKFRRVLARGLFEAIEQLRDWPHAVVVVYTDLLPEPAMTRAVFNAITATRVQAFRNLMCLLILPTQYMFSERIHPLLLLNQQNSACKNSGVVAALMRKLEPQVY